MQDQQQQYNWVTQIKMLKLIHSQKERYVNLWKSNYVKGVSVKPTMPFQTCDQIYK